MRRLHDWPGGYARRRQRRALRRRSRPAPCSGMRRLRSLRSAASARSRRGGSLRARRRPANRPCARNGRARHSPLRATLPAGSRSNAAVQPSRDTARSRMRSRCRATATTMSRRTDGSTSSSGSSTKATISAGRPPARAMMTMRTGTAGPCCASPVGCTAACVFRNPPSRRRSVRVRRAARQVDALRRARARLTVRPASAPASRSAGTSRFATSRARPPPPERCRHCA